MFKVILFINKIKLIKDSYIKNMYIIDISRLIRSSTFNRQILWVQPIGNIRKISEHIQANNQ